MSASMDAVQAAEQARRADALRTRATAECVCSRRDVEARIDLLAAEIEGVLGADDPLLLCVMNGGLPFTAALLARLDGLLEVDYLHATRYRGTRGHEVTWLRWPERDLSGRDVLVIDDVLDAGITLAAVMQRVRAAGVASARSAVLVDKHLPDRVIDADFVALRGPDRYLFGWGMDYHGHWRNLMDIWAVSETQDNGHE